MFRWLVLFVPAVMVAAEADLILHNGKVITVDAAFSIQQAVAIQGSWIVAVGTSAEVLRTWRGSHTEVIDLAGRSVLPGLIDNHVHALSAALSEFRRPLPPLDSYAAVQSFIRDRARQTPPGKWIVVPRTFPTRLKEMRMPTRQVLDVTPEYPVAFDASYVWVVNSEALKRSGITRHTPNPPGGEIVRDAGGEPNGILRNASSLLKGLDPAETYTREEKLRALEAQLRRYLEAGLTMVHDRAVTGEDIELFQTLHRARRLPVRVILTWRLNADPPAEELIQRIRQAPYTTNQGDEWLKFGAFKVTLDGGMTIGTAFQRAPYGAFGRQLYGHTNPDDRGQLFIPAPKLRSVMEAARGRGWQLTAHSQGGGAVDALLDAFEALPASQSAASTRSHLMHGSFHTPESIARCKRLGVSLDAQPAWLHLDGPALSRVFPGGGMRFFTPLRSLLDAGVRIAGGSDHMTGHDKNRATNPYNPFLSLWIAVTRRTTAGTVIHPEERVSRVEALRMYTIWPAWMQFCEDSLGSIETGKRADLVVIDRDYLTCPEDDIRRIEPLTVVLDGRLVLRR